MGLPSKLLNCEIYSLILLRYSIASSLQYELVCEVIIPSCNAEYITLRLTYLNLMPLNKIVSYSDGEMSYRGNLKDTCGPIDAYKICARTLRIIELI